MGAHFAGWPVAGPIRPVPGAGRGVEVCVWGGRHGFYPWLAFAILSCLALLLFTFSFEAFLTLPNSGCSIRFRSYTYIYSMWPGSGAMKNIMIFFTIRLDSVDSIFGYRFDFDFIGYSVFFQISQFRFRSGSDSKDFGYGYHLQI